MDNKSYICKVLGHEDLICQLAEESSELSQAALKYRRAAGYSENFTPVDRDDAQKKLLEEAADVLLCLHVLELDTGVAAEEISKIMDAKLERWADRLRKNTANTTREG